MRKEKVTDWQKVENRNHITKQISTHKETQDRKRHRERYREIENREHKSHNEQRQERNIKTNPGTGDKRNDV